MARNPRVRLAASLVALIGGCASLWHGSTVLRFDGASRTHQVAAGIAVALLVWSARLARGGERWLAARLAGAGATAMTAALLGFDVALARGPLHARGSLAILAAAAVLGTVVLGVARPPGPASRASGLTLKLATSATALLLLLAGAEAVLRLVFPLHVYEIVPADPGEGPCLVRDEQGRARLRPGFRGHYAHPEFGGVPVAINAWGLRDDARAAAPPAPGERSVLVLGDSFAFGTGLPLEDTFHARLEARADELGTGPLRVYGAGVPGHGPLDELATLHALGPRTRPDVVVVALFEGNDLADDQRARRRIRAIAEHGDPDHGPEPRASAGRRRGPPLPVFVHSLGYAWYWNSTSVLVQATRFWAEPLLVRLGIMSAIVPTNPLLEHCLQAEPTPPVRRAVRGSRRWLRRMREVARRHGARLLILVIPAAVQAEPTRFEQLRARRPEPEQLSRTSFHERLVAVLRHDGFAVVDPLPALEAEARAGKPCYFREGHWNARGHEIAADALGPAVAAALTPR